MEDTYSFFIELPMASHRATDFLVNKIETMLLNKELSLIKKTSLGKRKLCSLLNIKIKTDYENEIISIEAIVPGKHDIINSIELDPFLITIENKVDSIIPLFYNKKYKPAPDLTYIEDSYPLPAGKRFNRGSFSIY